MSVSRHDLLLEMGQLAFARGYLDLRRLLSAMIEAGRLGDSALGLCEFWVEMGLTEAHAASLEETARKTLAEPDGETPSEPPQDDITTEDLDAETASLSGSAPLELIETAQLPAQLLPDQTPSLTGGPRFSLVGLLGTGGMGQVVEYEDRRLGRTVAVKSLRHDLTDRVAAAYLLRREAKVTGGLEHPSIVPVYDVGTDGQLGPFYMMRVLKQPNLLDVLLQLRRGDRAATAEYTLGKLLRYFTQVCQAIDYAHTRGIIHCDIKPANILLGRFGEVLVVDWGFALRMGEASTHRGGTPGYMAPEQLDPRPDRIDARTDVFALGAVLYEIITLKKAFKAPTVDELVAAVQKGHSPFEPARSPLEVAPDRNISPELADICMRALELEPPARHQSARELAAELDAYLEGTKERERRLARAREFTEQGEGLSESHEELLLSRPERVAEVASLRASVQPWQGTSHKQPLWDAEDRQAVLDALCIRTFQAAVSAFEHALEELPGFDPARRGLARLYLGELQRAEERRDDFDRVYFEGLVRQFDDGTFGLTLAQQASLTFGAGRDDASLSLHRVVDQGRRLVRQPEPLCAGRGSLSAQSLEPGSYEVTVSVAGSPSFTAPLLLRAGDKIDASVDAQLGLTLGESEVLVAAGKALLGGHPSSVFGDELVEVPVPTFAIARAPVTFADYLSFLEDLALSTPDVLGRYLPQTEDDSPYWEWDGATFIPTARLRKWGKSTATLLCLPAFGVDLKAAQAFAAWRSRKTQIAYRLPTEAEWEKAARGVDGRRYPWGDHFDASFCKMRASRPGAPRPEPSGAFEADVSPYGVIDLAGGVAEWVTADAGAEAGGLVASRGGAWCDWPGDCLLAARRPYLISERSARVGFRLARSMTAS